MSKRGAYHGNARFFELGSKNTPMRTVFNIDSLANIRFEEDIREHNHGTDEKPEIEPTLFGYKLILMFNNGREQSIGIQDEKSAMDLYNGVLDAIQGLGAPITRGAKLKPMPEPSGLVDEDGQPVPISGDKIAKAIDEAIDAEEEAPNDDGPSLN